MGETKDLMDISGLNCMYLKELQNDRSIGVPETTIKVVKDTVTN